MWFPAAVLAQLKPEQLGGTVQAYIPHLRNRGVLPPLEHASGFNGRSAGAGAGAVAEEQCPKCLPGGPFKRKGHGGRHRTDVVVHAAATAAIAAAAAGGDPSTSIAAADVWRSDPSAKRKYKCGRCGGLGHSMRTCMSSSHADGQTVLEGSEPCARCDRPMHVHEEGRRCSYSCLFPVPCSFPFHRTCARCDRPMHVHEEGRKCSYRTTMDGAPCSSGDSMVSL